MVNNVVNMIKSKEIEKMLLNHKKELDRLQVKKLSFLDPVNTLYSRRNDQHQFIGNKKTFTIVKIDLDHFKKIIDQYGYTFGDIALQTFGDLLKKQITSPNLVAKCRGEGFLLLFPKQSGQETKKYLEALQKACSDDHLLKYRMDSIHLSFSAGICEVKKSQGFEEMIKCADQALYEAKSLGRKQIILYSEGLSIL